MKYATSFLFVLICNSLIGINVINIDNALIEHRKMLNEFEPYLKDCRVESYSYSNYEGDITSYSYEFKSPEAKKLFKQYSEKYDILRSKIEKNYILRGLILGLMWSTYNRLLQKDVFDKKIALFHLALVMGLPIYDRLSREKEAYIHPRNLRKYENLFALESRKSFMEVLVILCFSLAGRIPGEFICRDILKWN